MEQKEKMESILSSYQSVYPQLASAPDEDDDEPGYNSSAAFPSSSSSSSSSNSNNSQPHLSPLPSSEDSNSLAPNTDLIGVMDPELGWISPAILARVRLKNEALKKELDDLNAGVDDFQFPSREEMQRQIDQEEQEKRKLTHPFESEPQKQFFYNQHRELAAILEGYKTGNAEDAKQIFKAKAHFMYGMDRDPLFYTFFVVMGRIFDESNAKSVHNKIIKHIPGEVRVPSIVKNDSADSDSEEYSFSSYDVCTCSNEIIHFSMDILKSFITSLEQKYPRLFDILEKNEKSGGLLADKAISLMLGGLLQLHKTQKLESILNPEGKEFDLKDFFVRLLEKNNNPFIGNDFIELRKNSLEVFYEELEKSLYTPKPEKKSGNFITNLFNAKKKKDERKEEAIPLPSSYYKKTFAGYVKNGP